KAVRHINYTCGPSRYAELEGVAKDAGTSLTELLRQMVDFAVAHHVPARRDAAARSKGDGACQRLSRTLRGRARSSLGKSRKVSPLSARQKAGLSAQRHRTPTRATSSPPATTAPLSLMD